MLKTLCSSVQILFCQINETLEKQATNLFPLNLRCFVTNYALSRITRFLCYFLAQICVRAIFLRFSISVYDIYKLSHSTCFITFIVTMFNFFITFIVMMFNYAGELANFSFHWEGNTAKWSPSQGDVNHDIHHHPRYNLYPCHGHHIYHPSMIELPAWIISSAL